VAGGEENGGEEDGHHSYTDSGSNDSVRPAHGGFGSRTQVSGSALKNALIRSANASRWVVSHSHIVSTFHPAAWSFFTFSRSLR